MVAGDAPPYLLALRLAGRRVTIIGGGSVAARRIPALLDSGADVVVVSPELTPMVAERVSTGPGGRPPQTPPSTGPGGRPPQTPPLGPAARIQDPYGYRAFPQVHGPALDAARSAEQTITIELNARAENPLIDVGGEAVWHNGNFHTAYVGLALDAVRAAVFQAAALSAARLGTLVEPTFTGLAAFLATDPPPSSGIMILEYVSHSAIGDIRRLAAPAALGSAVLSRGVEEHAGFSTQSARATTDVVAAYRIVLACELVAAARALRLRGLRPVSAPLAQAFDLAVGALPADTADRPLDGDLTGAERLLPALAAIASAAGD
jgi:histidine ammonia-lyase